MYLRKGIKFLGMRIVFMGTPEFAVASLAALIHAGEEVVAVVTGPDKPAGRGQKLRQSAVKEYAVAKGIPVLQPERLKSEAFLQELRSYQADLQVVVAFRMLPEVVWDMPRLGTLNLHASLLPQYRGAAPINHAIINGETETGVTTFLLQHEIDTGHVLFSEKVNIAEDETAGELHDKLMDVGSNLVVKTVKALANGEAKSTPQEQIQINGQLHAAPKIFKEHCLIDWNKPMNVVYNQIRGLSPYPTAYTTLNGKTLKIYRAEKHPFPSSESTPKAGTVQTDGKSYLDFATENGYLRILELQLEGKKKMEIDEFLRGYRFE